MHLKMLLSNWGLKTSKSTPGCRDSALLFFVNLDTTNGFVTLRSFRNVSFLLLDLPMFHCCKANRGLKNVTQRLELRTPEDDNLHIYRLAMLETWS